MKLMGIWVLLKSAVSEWIEDGAPRLGAALSYYTVFALPPLFVIAIFVASLSFDEETVRKELFAEVGGLIGEKGAAAIQSALHSAQPHTRGLVASVIAIATLILTSTGLFLELQTALNAVWGVRPKGGRVVWGFIKNRLLSFAMVLGIGFLLIVSLIISTALSVLSKYLGGMLPGLASLWTLANTAGSFLIITCLFAMIYKWLPDVRMKWADVWVGAAITSLLFTAGKFLLGAYLGQNTAVSTYGAAGSVVLILLWVYYSAQILLLGAEITQVYACQYGARLELKPHAEWIMPGHEQGGRAKSHALRQKPDRKVQLVGDLRKQVEHMRSIAQTSRRTS